MAIYRIVIKMGGGKTLLSTLYALEYTRMNPKNKVYANYKLMNIPNFLFCPAMILPFSELENCLIIYDDMSNADGIHGLTKVIVNASRKSDINIIFTLQYYSMLKKEVRALTIPILVWYNEISDILYLAIGETATPDEDCMFNVLQVDGAVKIGKNYYNTFEKVKFINESMILTELKNISHNTEDLETNIEYMFRNKSDRTRIKKLLIG